MILKRIHTLQSVWSNKEYIWRICQVVSRFRCNLFRHHRFHYIIIVSVRPQWINYRLIRWSNRYSFTQYSLCRPNLSLLCVQISQSPLSHQLFLPKFVEGCSIILQDWLARNMINSSINDDLQIELWYTCTSVFWENTIRFFGYKQCMGLLQYNEY